MKEKEFNLSNEIHELEYYKDCLFVGDVKEAVKLLKKDFYKSIMNCDFDNTLEIQIKIANRMIDKIFGEKLK